MAGRQSAATENAVRAYKPGDSVYLVAAHFGISPSTLYRALRWINGRKKRKSNLTRRA